MKHVLGSVGLIRRATLACLLATGAQVACGKVESIGDDGPASGGTFPVDADDGTTASGGQATGTGGTLLIDPLEEPPPPPGPCDDPELDPPCNDDDLHGSVFECVGHRGISFEFPLTGITPPKDDLHAVCLPLDSVLDGGGLGGMGGADNAAVAPLVLAPTHISPSTAGRIYDDGFDLNAPAESGSFHLDVSEWPDGCLQQHDPSDNWYAVGQIALVEGETILSQHRLLVDYGYGCLR